MSHAWTYTKRTAPRRISVGQTAALMLIGFLVSLALGLVLFSGCKRPEPPPPRDLGDLERTYVIFFSNVIEPLAKRDGMKHASGGCDASSSDLLCAECFDPGGEVWVRCVGDACKIAVTTDELAAVGADLGVCERPEARDGLALSFERKAH